MVVCLCVACCSDVNGFTTQRAHIYGDYYDNSKRLSGYFLMSGKGSGRSLTSGRLKVRTLGNIMLDQVLVFSKGGLVLWSKTFVPLEGRPVGALVSSVLLEVPSRCLPLLFL